MANIFENIAKGITAPIGGAMQGALRGLAPGYVQQAQLSRQRQDLIADIERIRAAGGIETEAGRKMLAEMNGKYTADMFRTSGGAAMPPLDSDVYGPPGYSVGGAGDVRITYRPKSPQDRWMEQILGGGAGGAPGQPPAMPGTEGMPLSSMSVGAGGPTYTYKKPEVTAGERQRKQSLEQLHASGQEVLKLYDEYNGENWTGILDSRLGEFRELTGIGLKTVKGPDGKQYAPETAFRIHVFGFVKKMYTDSGKQLSDKEMATLNKTFPRLSVSDAAFRTALNTWIEGIVRDIDAFQRTGESPLLSGGQSQPIQEAEPEFDDMLGLY